jgi:mannose-6-phosphate isomerase-like protein (cupin superfamily)
MVMTTEVFKRDLESDERPWGHYRVLANLHGFKVKEISVRPMKRLSLQRHRYRAEHWYIVRGKALVTLDEANIPLTRGGSIDIPTRSWHRIKNAGNDELVFVEIQTGSYFGEDDIERREDDFGRV